MELYWLGLGLFLFLFAQTTVITSPLYWLSFFILIYVFTYPRGPAQSIHKRIIERRTAPKVPCSHCEKPINAQDVMCFSCKLQLSLGGGV